jgi:aconitate hydratase
MSTALNPFNALRPFTSPASGKSGYIYSLPALEEAGLGKISRLPVSIRIVLESVLRNCDGLLANETDVKTLAAYNAKKPSDVEIPFVVSRIVLQDFTGVPLLVDLAAMRDAVKALGKNPAVIEPLVPVDLVVDHSVQVDKAGTPGAFTENLRLEFERNNERYEFLKWGMQAFETFSVVPPAIGIVHQVNLEYLAKLVFEKKIADKAVFYPDSLVGTDSHTTMINGLGIVGWGVGGIEAEAGMLGQPVAFQTPEVIGVHLTGKLTSGVTATDMTLRLTEILRKAKVVGKFVEFYGEGAEALSLADRATIANMAPEYGATMGFFPVDEKSLDYLRQTGRDEAHIALIKDYYTAQNLFGIPKSGTVDYTQVVELDLATVQPCVAGPKRPQDRIDLVDLKTSFNKLIEADIKSGGFGIAHEERARAIALPERGSEQLKHGSAVIAAITSCTNTSNPSVMIAAGLVAKKAVEKGLTKPNFVKASLGPGSRVVTDYLNATGLQTYLDQVGFNLVGYGCTTCIGNSGPLDADIEKAIKDGNLVTASVLSGNRNFEARVHGAVKSNFLMSPPLVVAFALAGRADIDMATEPLGTGSDGKPVFLKDIWPTTAEIDALVASGLKPEMFKSKYADLNGATKEWGAIAANTGNLFSWKESSTYIQLPPFFQNFSLSVPAAPVLKGLRPVALLGDSVTTDHISPAGSFSPETPAGRFLTDAGVKKADFNSYGSRRGNDRIMTRGTFANVQIKNRMADGKDGGFTKLQPEGKIETIYDACMTYKTRGESGIVFGGVDYGMGSSRDWAAKGTALLGIKVVVAKSFERIHRSNLLGMGVLPLEFKEGRDADALKLDGTETFDIVGLTDPVKPKQEVTLVIRRATGATEHETLTARIDTLIEAQYYRNGGIMPYVLRNILK